MANKKISELTVATTVENADELIINQSGVTKKVTKSILLEGAGGSTFTMPTSTLTNDDAGKLVKASAGLALLPDIVPPVAPTPRVFQIEIQSVGVVGTPAQQAFGTVSLVNQPAAQSIITITTPQHGLENFMFENDPMMVPPSAHLVQIGPSIDSTLSNLANEITAYIPSEEVTAQFNLDPMVPDDSTVTVTAGGMYEGINGNNLISITKEGDMANNITIADVGALGEFINGVDGVAGSSITINDPAYFGGFQISAGSSWIVQGNINDEANAIANSLTNELMAYDLEGRWQVSVMGSDITLERTLQEEDGPESIEVTDSNVWSMGDALVVLLTEGSTGVVETAQGPYVGKLVSVAAGVATIDSSRVITLTNAGNVPNGVTVVISTAGRIQDIANASPSYQRVGIAIVGGLDTETSTILLATE